MNSAEYPELNKVKAVSAESQVQGEFLEWLGSIGIVLGRYNDRDKLHPIHATIESLLADYHGIDLEKVEEERRAILNNIREINP